MDSRLKALVAERQEAVQSFIDSRPDLFRTRPEEVEEHREHCDGDECSMCAGATLFSDGWMLVVRQVTLEGDREETWLKITSCDMTWSRQIGLAEYVRDALGR